MNTTERSILQPARRILLWRSKEAWEVMKMTAHLSAPDAWVDVVERFSNVNNKTLKSVSPSIVYINIIYM